MTETLDTTKIDEIRAIIDRGLGTTQSRELIAASEVADLLLDLRLLLATTDADLEAAPTNCSVGPLAGGSAQRDRLPDEASERQPDPGTNHHVAGVVDPHVDP